MKGFFGKGLGCRPFSERTRRHRVLVCSYRKIQGVVQEIDLRLKLVRRAEQICLKPAAREMGCTEKVTRK